MSQQTQLKFNPESINQQIYEVKLNKVIHTEVDGIWARCDDVAEAWNDYFVMFDGKLLYLASGRNEILEKLANIDSKLFNSYNASHNDPLKHCAFFSAYVFAGKEQEFLTDYYIYQENIKKIRAEKLENEKKLELEKIAKEEAKLQIMIEHGKAQIIAGDWIDASLLVSVAKSVGVKVPIKTIGSINKGNIVSCNADSRRANGNIGFAICDYYKQVRDLLI